ncbi:MAG: hypothetical protein ACN4GZ_20220 [Acidimicrobiales bacterium]
MNDPLTAPIAGATSQEFAGSLIEFAAVGDARIKRIILPVGSRWSENVKPIVGTEFCEHAHVAFLARGRFVGEYADGETFDHQAPAIIAVDPGHDSWVEGDEEVILIQFDFETDTLSRLGLTSRTSGETVPKTDV